jgi:hypothetical protein
MHSPELERFLDRALKQLPTPRAPHTLLPRVMAAVRAHLERPWYTRAWVTWPTGWQTVSVAALLGLIVGGILLMPIARGMVDASVPAAASGYAADVAGATRGLLRAAGRAETATTAAWIVWRVLFAPFVAYAVGVVALMCVACAAVGATLNHVTLGKASLR